MTGSIRQIVKKVFTMTLTVSMAIALTVSPGLALASSVSSATSESDSASSQPAGSSTAVKAVDDALECEDASDEEVIDELDEDRDSYHQENGHASIDIPKDPSDGVTLDTEGAGSITMGLPREIRGEEGELDDGTVVYDNAASGVSVAIQAVSTSETEKNVPARDDPCFGCVRSFIVIDSPDAPKEYSFRFNLSKDQSLKAEKDGSVFVIENGEQIAEIQPAWARDADGEKVESYFTVKGNTLIQHVSFDSDTVFPVVADPAMSGYYYRKSNVRITNEYGGWKRTSSILNTHKTKGGTLTVNESHTISGSVSGNIKGIVTIGTGASITTSTSRSWNIGKNKRCYAQCRAEFRVERGTRKKISMNTGKTVETNSYTVKKPRGKNYREFRVHYL